MTQLEFDTLVEIYANFNNYIKDHRKTINDTITNNNRLRFEAGQASTKCRQLETQKETAQRQYDEKNAQIRYNTKVITNCNSQIEMFENALNLIRPILSAHTVYDSYKLQLNNNHFLRSNFRRSLLRASLLDVVNSL